MSPPIAALALATLMSGLASLATAQTTASTELSRELAPTGRLRVAVLMLSYFASEDGGDLRGWSPELGAELARRIGMPRGPVRRDEAAGAVGRRAHRGQ